MDAILSKPTGTALIHSASILLHARYRVADNRALGISESLQSPRRGATMNRTEASRHRPSSSDAAAAFSDHIGSATLYCSLRGP